MNKEAESPEISEVMQRLDKILENAKNNRNNQLLQQKTQTVGFRCSIHLKAWIIERSGEMGISISDFVEYCIARSEVAFVTEQEIITLKTKVLPEMQRQENELIEQRKLLLELSKEAEAIREREAEAISELEAIKTAFNPILEAAATKGIGHANKMHKPQNLKELGQILSLINHSK